LIFSHFSTRRLWNTYIHIGLSLFDFTAIFSFWRMWTSKPVSHECPGEEAIEIHWQNSPVWTGLWLADINLKLMARAAHEKWTSGRTGESFGEAENSVEFQAKISTKINFFTIQKELQNACFVFKWQI
jgi:hypothetical protein